jgi:hypothetical protein
MISWLKCSEKRVAELPAFPDPLAFHFLYDVRLHGKDGGSKKMSGLEKGDYLI